jgi:predicted nuclease of predicted toxin-antitoxin system
MKFKIDENLPREVAALLRTQGHDAETVSDERLVGEPDGRIWNVCQLEGRVLVTLDTDFSNLQEYPLRHCPGTIVLRLSHQDKYRVMETISRLLPLLLSETLTGRLWVVDEQRVRIRE